MALMKARSWRWLRVHIDGLLIRPPRIHHDGTLLPTTRIGWRLQPPKLRERREGT